MDIEGTHALVIGGSGGIGRETARALASRGARVTIQYASSRARAAACVDEIEAHGGTARVAQAAVDEPDDVAALVSDAADAFGTIQTVVNSAGFTRFVGATDLDGLSDEIWERSFRVNVMGPWYVMRAVLPAMTEAGQGCIVNVASRAGISGTGSSIAYSASKAALINMTKALARAYAPAVRINAVAPGFVDTGWFEANGMSSSEAVDGLRESWIRMSPLHRAATAEDVASAIEWLVCGADLVTGDVLVLDAGLHLGASAYQGSVGAGSHNGGQSR